MYKLKKNERCAEVSQDIQLHAFLSSGWELIPEEEAQKDAPLTDEEIVLETDAVVAPKRRGRARK